MTTYTTFLSTAVRMFAETATIFSATLDSLPEVGQSFSQFLLADTSGVLRGKLGEVLTMIMLFGFLIGTIRIMGGATQMRRGETDEGKNAITSGALIAAAPLIMKVLFGV